MAKRIICPFKIDDRVVLCSSRTSMIGRGRVGTITNIHSNLTALIRWDKSSLDTTGKTPLDSIAIPIYDIKPEIECHNCIFRLTHLIGGVCSADWKAIQNIQTKVEESNEE